MIFLKKKLLNVSSPRLGFVAPAGNFITWCTMSVTIIISTGRCSLPHPPHLVIQSTLRGFSSILLITINTLSATYIISTWWRPTSVTHMLPSPSMSCVKNILLESSLPPVKQSVKLFFHMLWYWERPEKWSEISEIFLRGHGACRRDPSQSWRWLFLCLHPTSWSCQPVWLDSMQMWEGKAGTWIGFSFHATSLFFESKDFPFQTTGPRWKTTGSPSWFTSTADTWNIFGVISSRICSDRIFDTVDVDLIPDPERVQCPSHALQRVDLKVGYETFQNLKLFRIGNFSEFETFQDLKLSW